MVTSITTLKNWFKTGKFPTQSQFWAWIDSFRHKDDKVPVAEIDGLNQLLDLKVDKEFINGSIIPIVSNYSELTNYPNPTEGMIIRCLGAVEANDGGEGLFTLKNSISSIDFGTILPSNKEDNLWLRNYDNKTVNVLWFGAKADATPNEGYDWNGTDSTTAFERAISTGKQVEFPSGKFIVSKNSLKDPEGIYIKSNQNLVGVENQTQIVMNGYVNGDQETYYSVFRCLNVENVSISGIEISGHHFGYEEELTFNYACVGIWIFGESTKNISVKNCVFTSILGHGIQDNCTEPYNRFIRNKANYCSQNGMNINSKYPFIFGNYGKFNGFGLIEASCGGGIIINNKAEFNYIGGITVGGYNAEETFGFGNNNLISGNVCNNNLIHGIQCTIGVIDSIVSNNICYENGTIGIILNENFDKESRNLVTGNKVFDNGTEGAGARIGIYVNSKKNIVTANEIYNTGKEEYGHIAHIGINSGMNDNTIKNNELYGPVNYDISVNPGITTGLVIEQSSFNNIEIPSGCTLAPSESVDIIAWVGYPIKVTTKMLIADNPSSAKEGILPPAAKYPKGQTLLIYDGKGAAASFNITITPNGSDKINGSTASQVISTNYGYLRLICDGIDNWIIIN